MTDEQDVIIALSLTIDPLPGGMFLVTVEREDGPPIFSRMTKEEADRVRTMLIEAEEKFRQQQRLRQAH